MKTRTGKKVSARRLTRLGLVLALVVLLASVFVMVLNMPTRVYEATDFLGYWASANLLAHRQNPYDQAAMLALEQDQGWAGDDPMYSWNPPWLHVLLLPLGVLPFRTAAALWFIANPLLIGASGLLIWHTSNTQKRTQSPLLALLLVFFFSRTLHTILEGQTNTLILVGCAGFVALSARRRDTMAGAALALATVKPHVSYLLVPGVLLVSVLQGRWRICLGFLAALLLLTTVATCLFPTWMQTYQLLFDVSASPLDSARYTTPTIRGVLRAITGYDVGIWPSLACLAIFLALLWRQGSNLDFVVVASISLLVGLPTAPFGWSTDQIVLLLPILQAVVWSQDLRLPHKRVVAASLFLTYTYAAIVWLVNYRDVALAAVPPMIGFVWAYVYTKAPSTSLINGRTVSRSQHAVED